MKKCESSARTYSTTILSSPFFLSFLDTGDTLSFRILVYEKRLRVSDKPGNSLDIFIMINLIYGYFSLFIVTDSSILRREWNTGTYSLFFSFVKWWSI